MMKRDKFFASLSCFALMGRKIQALRDAEYAENFGGIGTPKDKILYHLITEDTLDTEEGYELSI